MITSKKSHTLTFNTYASFIAINTRRKPFGSEFRTEQGCMIHLTAEEAKQLGEAVPEIDFNKYIKVHSELEYLERLKAQAPSGYVDNGIIRTMNVKSNDPLGKNPIELMGDRSKMYVTEDPLYRTAVKVTLEVFDYMWKDEKGTSLRLHAIAILEA